MARHIDYTTPNSATRMAESLIALPSNPVIEKELNRMLNNGVPFKMLGVIDKALNYLLTAKEMNNLPKC